MGIFSWINQNNNEELWTSKHQKLWDFIEKKIPIAIYQSSCDLDRKLIFCNQTFSNIIDDKNINTGFQKDKEVFLKSFVHPDDIKTMDFRYSEAIRTKSIFHHEFRIIKPSNGEVVWVVDRGNPIIEKGKLIISGYIEDITYLKSLKDKSKFDDPWLMDATLSSTDAIWDWRTVQNNISVTRGLSLLLGYGNDDTIGNNIEWWQENMHPDDWPGFANFMTIHIENPNDIILYEFRLKKKDGSYNWVSFKGVSQTEGSGKVIRMAGTITDISSYKKMQNELILKANDTKKSSDAKSTFIASLNHDLRAPTSGIVGMASLLEETELNDNQKKYIKNIKLSCKILLEIINDILDISKIEAGKLEIFKNPTNVSEIAELTSDILKSLVANKKINIHLNIDNNFPKYFLTDAKRIKQVLINLCSNSAKFTMEGDIFFNISSKKINDNKHEVEFSIKDTGVGIPEIHKKNIFDEYNQGSNSDYGGTGLGLSICKKIIEIMEGEIWFESQENEGTTFFVKIPMEETNEIPKNPDHDNVYRDSYTNKGINYNEECAEKESFGKEGPNTNSKLRILIAEDNMVNQEVMKGLIANFGDEIVLVENGRDAVEKFNNNDFDLILMDINMPIMDGLTATECIRKTEKGKTVPIIAVTANTMDADRDICIQRGMNDVMHKPISKVHLSKILSSFRRKVKNETNEMKKENNKNEDIMGKLNGCMEKIEVSFDTLETLKKDLGEEKISKLVSMYLKDASSLVNKMKECDIPGEIHLDSHNLAGMSENLGINEVGKISRKIMKITKNDSMANEEIKYLTNVFDQVKKTLESNYGK